MRLLPFFAALLLVPLVAAGPQPQLLFLADGESPLSAGALSTDHPQGNESSIRLVGMSVDGPSVSFISGPAPAEALKGRVFVGIWTDSSVVAEGNLSAQLYLVADGQSTLIANASRNVALDPNSAPDPTALIPPDPTDPEGAAYHIAAQVLPLLLKPPMLLDLGIVDIQVPANATLSIGFSLIAADGSQVPVGLASIKYGATLSPSFVYVPWYTADPVTSPTPTTSTSGTTTSGSSSSPSSGPAPSPSSPSEESPGLAIVAVLGLIAVAALLRRR